MNSITRIFFAGAVLLCATLTWTVPAKAVAMYSVTLETTTEPATFEVTSSVGKLKPISVSLGKNEKKTIDIDPLPYEYNFTIVRCGGSMQRSWHRDGSGVSVIAGGCGSLSLIMKR